MDSVLIYIYSGWRISELILMPASDIDLQAGAFRGGLKTKSGKNRIVPIHSKIRGFVENRLAGNRENALFLSKGSPISVPAYLKLFKKTLTSIGVTSYHTPHDCRHPYVKHKTKSFLRNSRVFKADFCAPSHSLCTEVFHFPDNINLISGVNIHTFNQCVSQGGI